MAEIEKIPLGRIFVSPDNHRREFDEQTVEKLADRIKKHGLKQPITVRPKNGDYELIIGESTLRACKMIGLTEIDARVETLDDSKVMELRLIENTNRTDLIDAEKGDAAYSLIERFPDKYPTIKDLADAIGKPLGTVTAWTQKSERLAESVRELVRAHKITEKAADYLLKYNDDIQSKLANIAADCPLNEPQAIEFFQLYDRNPHDSLSRARYLASIKLAGAAESTRPKKKA